MFRYDLFGFIFTATILFLQLAEPTIHFLHFLFHYSHYIFLFRQLVLVHSPYAGYLVQEILSVAIAIHFAAVKNLLRILIIKFEFQNITSINSIYFSEYLKIK